jgi:hypothetical protein
MDNLGRDMLERVVYFVVRNIFEDVTISRIPNWENRMIVLYSVLYSLNSLFGSCKTLHQEKKRLMDPVSEVLFCFIYTDNIEIQDKIPDVFPNDLFFFKQLCPESSKYFKYTSSLRLKYRYQVTQQKLYGQLSYSAAIDEYDFLMNQEKKLIEKQKECRKKLETAVKRINYHKRKHLFLVEKDNKTYQKKKQKERIEGQALLHKFWNPT